MWYKIASRFLVGQSLVKQQKRFYPELPKKFYKRATVTGDSNGHYEINLDGRKLKTPAGKMFSVNNEALAMAIAQEWNSQKGVIKRHEMHFTTLANTVLDNPNATTKETLVDKVIEFLNSDTLCFRIQEPSELYEMQCQKWDPVIEWFENRFECKVNVSLDVVTPIVSENTIKTLRHYLLTGSNEWSMTGLSFVVENLKSLILSLALLHKRLSVEEAVNLSRLELEFQMKRWGNVEWAHDMDLMSLRSRVSAGLLFTLFNLEYTSESVKQALRMFQSATTKGLGHVEFAKRFERAGYKVQPIKCGEPKHIEKVSYLCCCCRTLKTSD